MNRQAIFDGGPSGASPAITAREANDAGQIGRSWLGEMSQENPDYTRWVQQSLNRIMGLRLAVDGQTGRQTRSAIRSFQNRSRLSVDGVVGPRTEEALVAAGASRPPGGRVVAPQPTPLVMPQASGVPRLIKKEALPPAGTLYVEIDLGIRDQASQRLAAPMTGIFIPPGYTPASAVDLVLYLHGFTQHLGSLTIASYWDHNRFSFRPLHEGVNESQKNVVLVAPTLGPRSQTGRLTRPGGLDAFLDQILSALRAYGPYRGLRAQPTLGNLVLACHSGGGWPMRQLALSHDRYAANIRECWGFDCTYNRGDDNVWAGWARSHPSNRVFIYYLPNTQTQILSASLQQMNVSNAIVRASNARSHEWVPVTHWAERLREAAFLRNTGGVP